MDMEILNWLSYWTNLHYEVRVEFLGKGYEVTIVLDDKHESEQFFGETYRKAILNAMEYYPSE